MKRWLNEPLLHFLVLGALLFGIHGWLHRGESSLDNGGPVRITTKDIAFLAETFQRQRQREPTPEELRVMIAVFLKEELLGREARAMGLDQNDLVIRRRLAQKVEFIVEDSTRVAEPTDAELQRSYKANLELYQVPARISFTHVFFDPEKRHAAAADARAALAALSRGAPVARDTGDPFALDAYVRDDDRRTVAGQFGEQFANAVFVLKPGAWNGPITSSFGLHLVRVTEAKPMRQLEFSEVRPQVRQRWRDEHQREANQQYFATLLKKYGVVVDGDLKPFVGPVNELAAKAGGFAPPASETPGLK